MYTESMGIVGACLIQSRFLREAYKKKKLKINDIATMLGLSESYTFRVIDGQCGMKIDNLRKLCEILDLNFSDVVKGRFVDYE